MDNRTERLIRAPRYWLRDIKNPTFVFEGGRGNIDSLYSMRDVNNNPHIQFYPLEGYDHFYIIAPLSTLITEKIQKDNGVTTNIYISEAEVRSYIQIFIRKPDK